MEAELLGDHRKQVDAKAFKDHVAGQIERIFPSHNVRRMLFGAEDMADDLHEDVWRVFSVIEVND